MKKPKEQTGGAPAPERTTRTYRSPLREERSEQTRERILDALVSVMARNGIADISIPLVAREARVSIPSVYRYFPTKRDLVAALADYAHRKGSFKMSEFEPVESPQDLARIIPAVFKRREAIESTLSAAMNSSLGYAIRRPEFEERAQFLEKALRPATQHLNRKERAWLKDVVFVLNSFATVRAFKDYLGLDTDEAAKRVSWAIEILAHGAVTPRNKRPS